jgi:chromate reductase, NAD(P)H dehydrogenase (quinone)
MNPESIHILAISGSLRKSSSNSALLHATAGLAPANVIVSYYEGLNDLPHFNPEIDLEEALAPVELWRSQLKAADGVLICTPEYAKGVPGVLKNALDWIVSSGEFLNKPVAVLSASPTPWGGEYAHTSILLTLNMMDAKIAEDATLIVPHIGLKLSKAGVLTDPETELALKNVIAALIRDIIAQ